MLESTTTIMMPSKSTREGPPSVSWTNKTGYVRMANVEVLLPSLMKKISLVMRATPGGAKLG